MNQLEKITQRRGDEDLVDVVDRMPADLRPLVHEYGFSIVDAFLTAGVRKPAHIKHLVMIVRQGAREPGNKRAVDVPSSTRALNALSDALNEFGIYVPPLRFMRSLRDRGYTLLPYGGASLPMVEASMATVSKHDGPMTKQEKHFRRLQAALAAGDRELWGAS